MNFLDEKEDSKDDLNWSTISFLISPINKNATEEFSLKRFGLLDISFIFSSIFSGFFIENSCIEDIPKILSISPVRKIFPFSLLIKTTILIAKNKLSADPIKIKFCLLGAIGSFKTVGLVIISQGSSFLAFSSSSLIKSSLSPLNVL